jgi:putative transposase
LWVPNSSSTADRTAAQVARILRGSGGYSPSEPTLLRLFHRRELRGSTAGGGSVFGRFEAQTPNEPKG